MKNLIVLLCLILSLSFSISAQRPVGRSQPIEGQINGQVRFPNGQTGPQGIHITLEGHAGYVAQADTDSSGKFAFRSLGTGVFTLRAHYPGFDDVTQQVDLQTVATAYVQLEMKPSPGSGSGLPPAGAGVSIPAVPEDARKEFEKGKQQLMEKKDAKGSVAQFQKAIKAYPSYADAYFLMGTAYLDQQKWKEAQDALQKALQLNDKIPGAQLGLGSSLVGQQKFAEAEQPLLKGLQLDDKSAQGHYELARVYWALNRVPDADPHARKAVELDPTLAQAHVMLGNVMLRQRQNVEALKEFKEYLRLDPKGPMAPPVEELVKKIENALSGKK